jgi:hypothetical protein
MHTNISLQTRRKVIIFNSLVELEENIAIAIISAIITTWTLKK